MAKKKQFAGKKTKLAKLPLTQVLAGQGGETAPGGQLLAAPAPQVLPLERGEGTTGALTPVYLNLVQELLVLRSHLSPASPEFRIFTLPGEAEPHRLQQVLRQARESLLQLYHCLSGSSPA
jgi:hypothetical protein